MQLSILEMTICVHLNTTFRTVSLRKVEALDGSCMVQVAAPRHKPSSGVAIVVFLHLDSPATVNNGRHL